jgi:glycosyltransferase involved in cell wall biosynthesis
MPETSHIRSRDIITNPVVAPIEFSLVLATLGRTTELSNFLRHLDCQMHRNFELIVIDQNADDRLGPILSPYRDRFSIKHLRSPKGLSRARNVGLQHVSGHVIAFPDDDCWFDPDYLQDAAKLFLEHPEWDALTGGCKTPTGRWHFLDLDSGFVDKINVWRRAVSSSIFIRRSVVAKVGDFDERLGCGAESGLGSGEETDYLLRALERECCIYYQAGLAVNHPDDHISVQKGYRYGRGMGYVLRKHDYPASFVGQKFLRAFGGVVVSLAKFDLAQARCYYSTLRGRLSGWCA